MRVSILKKNKVFQKTYMKIDYTSLVSTPNVQKVAASGITWCQQGRGEWDPKFVCLHAVSTAQMDPTEKLALQLKLRRQIAAAAGRKSTTSLPLFMEAFALEVEEELSTLATQYWAK